MGTVGVKCIAAEDILYLLPSDFCELINWRCWRLIRFFDIREAFLELLLNYCFSFIFRSVSKIKCTKAISQVTMFEGFFLFRDRRIKICLSIMSWFISLELFLTGGLGNFYVTGWNLCFPNINSWVCNQEEPPSEFSCSFLDVLGSENGNNSSFGKGVWNQERKFKEHSEIQMFVYIHTYICVMKKKR